MKVEVGKFYRAKTGKNIVLQYYILSKIEDQYYTTIYKVARLTTGVFSRFSILSLNLRYFDMEECQPHPNFWGFLEKEIGKDKVENLKINLL